jgi:hypothetical protein
MPMRAASLRPGLTLVAATGLLLLAGCGAIKTTPTGNDDLLEYRLKRSASVFGDEGINFGGKSNTQDPGGAGTGIGVNAFLWRGSLDTLAFMPLSSADPFGGVIITDWFQPAPGERFKATAYILSRQLRADGLKVAIYRQVLQGNQWVDAPVSQATVTEMENKILARAREMRAEVSGN